VEDDRQRVREGQSAHAHGHGDRRLGVDQGPSQQLVGVVAMRLVLLVHRALPPSRDPKCEGCTTGVPMIIDRSAEIPYHLVE
jgi:hypothetical protein